MKRVIVAVGDIHGCLEEFDELLKTLQYKKEEMRLVLMGDLMDRGPDPVGCVRRARELGVECIMGNHEEKHLRWHRHEKKRLDTGKPNPMRPLAHEAMQANEALSDQDWTWMKALPLKLHMTGTLWAVHGGCEPRFTLDKQDPKQIIRCRYVDANGVAQALNPDKSQPKGTVYWSEAWQGPESIIYGHCVHDLQHVRVDHRIHDVQCVGIDTGCCFGGHLTAAFVSEAGIYEGKFVQVKAKQRYYHRSEDE